MDGDMARAVSVFVGVVAGWAVTLAGLFLWDWWRRRRRVKFWEGVYGKLG